MIVGRPSDASGAPVATGGALRTDTLMVGAGPQALTVLARWLCDRPSGVQDIVVVDPSGSWLHAWHRAFDRQRIDVLRSPGVHHPDPDEMAFIRAHRCGSRTDGRVGSAASGPLQRPTTVSFREFCRDLLERTGLSERVLPAAVVRVERVVRASRGARWEAQLSNGMTIEARQVVWAGNPRIPRTPRGVTCGETVVHANDVDLESVRPGQRIAVLGGGQTAGQLALEATRRGAVVSLINRGPQRIADLDVDAGWLMDDHLGPFRAITDPVERRRVVEEAQHGSMTDDLAHALALASVCRLDDAGDMTIRPTATGATVGFAGIECDVDLVWSATGSVPDLRAAPALAALAAGGAPHVDGWPVLSDTLEWLDGLFVVGALAALTLGPAAGNLAGARAAADVLAGCGPQGCLSRGR
ncbi:MAG: hypothetical protein AAF480_06890 [Actinomycetota bacterium]